MSKHYHSKVYGSSRYGKIHDEQIFSRIHITKGRLWVKHKEPVNFLWNKYVGCYFWVIYLPWFKEELKHFQVIRTEFTVMRLVDGLIVYEDRTEEI